MEIVLLGTSAALPTQSRWPTSTAVIRGGEILLFDCGEGTQIQFQKAQLRPGKLSRIFISHFHGDHLHGLIGLLTSLQLAGRDQPLSIYGPKGIRRYLAFMEDLSHFKFAYELEINEVSESSSAATIWNLGEYTIKALPLQHNVFVLGFRLEEKSRPGKFDTETAHRMGIPGGPLRRDLQLGRSVTLPSGTVVKPDQILGPPRRGQSLAICLDTRPCASSVELASGADVLIHEGTFDASKSDLALTTGHSTVAEAAEIAKQADVTKLLLTHISARYGEEDTPRLLAEAQAIFSNTTLGQDLLRISI
jgi:ribonuclease Z